MPGHNSIPREFIPFELYITQTTLAYISFSIPNTTENYEHFLTLIEPKLHPSIVEIQQLPNSNENIFIRISADIPSKTAGEMMEKLIGHASDILNSEKALKDTQDILNGYGENNG